MGTSHSAAIRGDTRVHKRTPLLPEKYLALTEILAYCTAILVATMGFLAGLISLPAAGFLATALLLSLTGLSWIRFDSGRHPCFLFLCLLTLFQAGRLILFCMGMMPDPFEIDLFVSPAFDVSTRTSAVFLLSLCLSALCIYAVCRWRYRFVLSERPASAANVLPYLYALFFLTIPFQILENFLFLRYANAHGGYLTFYADKAGLIASVPRPIHFAALFAAPAFLAIFVLEHRKLRLYAATTVYFASSAIALLTGSRSGTFSLIVVLWYISRMKSAKRPRMVRLVLIAVILAAVGNFIGNFRQDNSGGGNESLALSLFLGSQGNTMNVSELAIEDRGLFKPYALSYFLNEIKEAFVAHDQSNYQRGLSLADDITVLLNPAAFSEGLGTGSSFLGEAYIAGGILGVVVVSLLLGLSLDGLHRSCRYPFGLLVTAMILPLILWMARSGIFEWVAVLARDTAFVTVMFAGWMVYRTVRLGLSGRY